MVIMIGTITMAMVVVAGKTGIHGTSHGAPPTTMDGKLS